MIAVVYPLLAAVAVVLLTAGVHGLYVALRLDLSRRHRALLQAARDAHLAQQGAKKVIREAKVRALGKLSRRAAAARARRKALGGSATPRALLTTLGLSLCVISCHLSLVWALPWAAITLGCGAGCFAFAWPEDL